jgi:hypothetical protein
MTHLPQQLQQASFWERPRIDLEFKDLGTKTIQEVLSLSFYGFLFCS